MKKLNLLIPFLSFSLLMGLFIVSCSEDKSFEEETQTINQELPAAIKANEVNLTLATRIQQLDEGISQTAGTDLNKLFALYLAEIEFIATHPTPSEEEVHHFIRSQQNQSWSQVYTQLKGGSFFNEATLSFLDATYQDVAAIDDVERRAVAITGKILDLNAEIADELLVSDVLNGYLKVLESQLAPTATVRDCYSSCVSANSYAGLYWIYYNIANCPSYYSYFQCLQYKSSFALASVKQYCAASCPPPAPPTRRVELYEGNGGTQDLVGIISISSAQSVRFKSHSCCQNDEARSMKIFNMKAGERIAVYDDSDPNNPSNLCGDTKDDWMCIRAKRDFSYKLISTFERNPRTPGILINDADVIAYYGNGGNLDGKVSRFKKTN